MDNNDAQDSGVDLYSARCIIMMHRIVKLTCILPGVHCASVIVCSDRMLKSSNN